MWLIGDLDSRAARKGFDDLPFHLCSCSQNGPQKAYAQPPTVCCTTSTDSREDDDPFRFCVIVFCYKTDECILPKLYTGNMKLDPGYHFAHIFNLTVHQHLPQACQSDHNPRDHAYSDACWDPISPAESLNPFYSTVSCLFHASHRFRSNIQV